MPEKIIETINVKRVEILDERGNIDESLMPSLSSDDIKRMYELIILSRTFDSRAIALNREGRIGTYASILGQEASQVGSAFAVRREDWIFPSFREMGLFLTMGYPIHMLYLYWAGDERGLKTPDELNIFPMCIPVGTGVPHAVGAAMAVKYRGDGVAVVNYFGDGGTSKGDFHEGFNMAGVFRLPLVFICQNNQWAISVPIDKQTSSKTLAQKAFAYGFEGLQVDGNDIFAVYKVTKDAMEKARRGDGPTFIECFTYRLSDHTTSDDASKYRPKEEVEVWKGRDPLIRLRLFMEKRGLWSEEYQREVEERSEQSIDEAVREAEAIKPSEPEDLFRCTYESMTKRQTGQLEEF